MALAPPTALGNAALARCVGDVDRFATDHWGRRPLLRRRADERGFEDLFRAADVDYLLSTTALRSPAFRLVKGGETIDVRGYTRAGSAGPQRVHDLADVGRIWSLFDDGATIVLQGVQRYWLPLTRFCRELELALTHPTQTNVYVTPREERGLGVHYDTHDVFVLQIGGRKRWQVFDCLKEAPLPTHRSPQIDDPGPPTLETDLGPGDCLYVPRGWLHEAESLDETSVHLTVGILAHTWKDLFQDVLAGLDEDVRYRESLPIGFAEDPATLADALAERIEQVKRWLDGVDPATAGRALAERFWRTRTPLLVGQMEQLARLDTLSDESIVRRRPGCVCRLSVEEDSERLTLLLGDRELKLPLDLEPLLRSLLAAEEASVSELTELDAESRLVLVRRLIREGVLEAVG
jgi:lysine-specific demethylase/histidyl-hydroxylase NO66